MALIREKRSATPRPLIVRRRAIAMDVDARGVLRRSLANARSCSASVTMAAFDELDRREAEVATIDARAASLANQVQALRLIIRRLADDRTLYLAEACRQSGVDPAFLTQGEGLLGLDDARPNGGSAA